MNYDFLFGLMTGLGGELVVGVVMGVHQFRKGIEDGMRLHEWLESRAPQAGTEG